MQIRASSSTRPVHTPSDSLRRPEGRAQRTALPSLRKAVTATVAGLAALQRPASAHPTACGHAVKPQSNVYVSDSNGPAVLYYNATAGTDATTRIPLNATSANGLGFSPDGQRLYVTTSHQFPAVALAAIDTNPVSATFNKVVDTISLGNASTSFPAGVIVAPGGNVTYVATGFDIVVLDVQPGSATYHQVIKSVRIGTALKQQPAFTPDGRELWWPTDGAERNPTSSLVRLNADFSSPDYLTFTSQVLPLNESADAVAMNPSAPRTYVTGNVGDTVLVYDTASGNQSGSIAGGSFLPPQGGPTGLSGNAITGPQRHRLYAVTGTPVGLFVYDTANDKFVTQTALSNATSFSAYVGLAPNDTQAYVTNAVENVLRVVDVEKEPPMLRKSVPLEAGSQPGFLAVQPGALSIAKGLHDRITALQGQGILCASDAKTLQRSLRQATEAASQGCIAAARRHLENFLEKVECLRGHALNDALADDLAAAAQFLLKLLA